MTRILYTHSATRMDCQVEARAAVLGLQARGWDIEDIFVDGDDGYWKALARGWGSDILINIEQDIVVKEAQARGLGSCDAAACCIPYRLKTGEWSVYETVSGILTYHETPGVSAGGSALGLVKLSPEIQREIPIDLYPWDQLSWWGLDVWLSRYLLLLGKRWHVHPDTVRHVRPNID